MRASGLHELILILSLILILILILPPPFRLSGAGLRGLRFGLALVLMSESCAAFAAPVRIPPICGVRENERVRPGSSVHETE